MKMSFEDKKMKKGNKLLKNLIASILTYGMSFLISFFLSPYITKALGVEANGFVTLANQFVGYISLITIALTSMASRFISINIFKKNYEEANRYFNSVIGASVILVIVLSIPLVGIVLHIDRVVNVSSNLVLDVKILFALVFINFLLGLLLEVFSIATYVTNRLYLNSLRSIEGNIIRCFCIVIAYTFFEAKMYYVSIGAIVSGLYTYVWNIHYTWKCLPEMKIRRKYFSVKAIKELVTAGSWNIIIQLNNILNTGLDLLLGNVILGEKSMGILAVAKTIPVAISTMLNSVSGIFLPEMTQLYAEENIEGFTNAIKRSIKILALIFNIPVVFLIVYGKNFYNLWQPTLEPIELQILSLLTICTILVSGSTAAVFGIFTITNRLKFHSLTSLGGGLLNIIVVIVLLKIAPIKYGVYIVAGVSSALIILRNYFVTFPYAAKCIGQSWFVFHIPSLKTILGVTVTSIIGIGIKFIYNPMSWYTLIGAGVVIAVISTIVNWYIVLQKEDRKYLKQFIRKKVKR